MVSSVWYPSADIAVYWVGLRRVGLWSWEEGVSIELDFWLDPQSARVALLFVLDGEELRVIREASASRLRVDAVKLI